MKANLSKLLDKIPTAELKRIILKYSDIHSDLRDEILSSKFASDSEFDELSIKEWERRIKAAICKDQEDVDIGDYYFVMVSWDSTIKVIEKAVEDLCNRKLGQKIFDFLDFVETHIKEAEKEFRVCDEFDEEKEIEFDTDWVDVLDKQRIIIVRNFPEFRSQVFDLFKKLAGDGNLRAEWLENFKTKADRAIQLEVILNYLKTQNLDSEEPSVDFYAEQAFHILKEIDPKQIQEFFNKYSTLLGLRDLMEGYCIDKGDLNQAIELIEKDKDFDDLTPEKNKTLVDLYLKTGRKDQQ